MAVDLLRSVVGLGEAPRKAKTEEGLQGHGERTENVQAMEGSPVRSRRKGRDKEKRVTLILSCEELSTGWVRYPREHFTP